MWGSRLNKIWMHYITPAKPNARTINTKIAIQTHKGKLNRFNCNAIKYIATI